MMQHSSPETLVDYCNGELDPIADAAVYAHLAECSTCREEYEIERSIREALFESGQRSERELPASLVDSIWAATRPAKVRPLTALGAFLRPKLFIPALGGVFSIALGMVLFTGVLPTADHAQAAHPQVDAAAFLDRHSDASMAMPLSDHVNTPMFEAAADTGDASTESSGT
jgi:predicted anti-sigma-YlaC factor YlaD